MKQEVNRNHQNYSRPAQLRPSPSSDRNGAPVQRRYKMGRAPDESVWSYRARLHAEDPKKHPDPGDPPAPRRRAWLNRAEWEARDAKLRTKAAKGVPS